MQKDHIDQSRAPLTEMQHLGINDSREEPIEHDNF